MKTRIALVAAVLVLPLAASAQQNTFPSDSAVLAILKERVTDKRSAGMVVGILEPDGRTRIVAFGDAGPGQPPLDGNSVFEIGSISKVFTSTVLAQLVNEGKVKLEDPVRKFLPAAAKMPSRNGKEITLGNLSMQNSGLPRMPSNFSPADPKNPFADYRAPQLYAFLAGYTLPRDPGETFEYSNLGVGLLGLALSSAMGMSYEAMENERVWTPLGMTHTAITMTPWMKEHLALGHDESGAVTPNWDLGVLEGAGAIRSTTIDMLKFADANLHPERGAIGKAAALAQKERAPTTSPSMGIGLNWMNLHVGADTIVWHNGGTGGYRTFLGLQSSTKRAVVILTNTAGAGADDIGMHFLVPSIPLAPKPAAVKQRVAIEIAASKLEQYVGEYQLAPMFSIVVTVENGMLTGQATGQQKFRLWAETPRDFFIKEVDAQVTFEVDAAGTVTNLVLHQNGRDQPGKKVK